MNKLIKLTLCFMVNVCAGFEFTDSNGKPTDPSMWCAPKKRNEFKQLCDTAIENLNANSDSDSDSDDSPAINVNDDRTYLLMNIFSEKLEDENLIEEFKLQIPQNMSCRMDFDKYNMVDAFIKLIQNNYNVYNEKLVMQNLTVSSNHIMTFKSKRWENTSAFLQINQCIFSGEYDLIDLQGFPCNKYNFTYIICNKLYPPILLQCDMYTLDVHINMEIDENRYDKESTYNINLYNESLRSASPSASSAVSSNISSVWSALNQYKPCFEISKHNLDNLHIVIEKVQAGAYDLSTLLHAPNQSQGVSLSPRSSIASPTASELRGHSKSASPTSHKSSETVSPKNNTSPLPVEVPVLDMTKVIQNEDSENESSKSSTKKSNIHQDYALLPLPTEAQTTESNATSPQQDNASDHSGQTLIVDTNGGTLLPPSTEEAHEVNSTTQFCHSNESADVNEDASEQSGESIALDKTLETLQQSNENVDLNTVNQQANEDTALLSKKSAPAKKKAPAQQESTCCCSIS